jgi:hypothetical protein
MMLVAVCVLGECQFRSDTPKPFPTETSAEIVCDAGMLPCERPSR